MDIHQFGEQGELVGDRIIVHRTKLGGMQMNQSANAKGSK
jgi:hypothetical protein